VAAVDALIAHCEQARFRFALIDPPENVALAEVRAFRSRFDSGYAALYYPWLRIIDPVQGPDPGLPPTPLDVPPSGAVAGILARSDSERGVHHTPVNQVVRGITELVRPVSAVEQEVLKPEGVNTLRFFEGRGNLVWGARTVSSDPEWKYVNVRRLFIYLEHSIEKSTQWAVFEPNDERLWTTIQGRIEAFLTSIWRSGALRGSTPEEAFFVRCDRTTMTQNDLDNGRLVCEVGIAPVRPAEFVIIRIGQWTADAPGD
jgi:phage tail sheath protein FI